ncbi:MAG: DUF3750 domain-containing protein [Notoacmeibacter sp.]|nr:DUF3750 domain-containing protein [Notoacmeibacter sp.]
MTTRLLRWTRRFVLLVLVFFIAPALASAAWWTVQDRPHSWRDANWRSSGLLPATPARDDVSILVLAARTGGLKGALSVHSWIVIKRPGQTTYERYDKVGWGQPVRRNAYDADGYWYSNKPWIVGSVSSETARELLPEVDAAIAAYPNNRRGGYTIWPGPNSNSFVAHVLTAVPDLAITLPPTAVGRDYRPGLLAVDIAPDWQDVHVSLGGYAGFAVGTRSGLELHFLGLVTGIDVFHPALKLPGFGRIGF